MEKPRDYQFPEDEEDERELLLGWLGYLRGAVVRNLHGVSEEDAHRRFDHKLLPLAGIVNHLIGVERRWVDGGILGGSVYRSEGEFFPGPETTVPTLLAAYRDRGVETDRVVRSHSLDTPDARGEGVTLRWVLLHLINETARHAGHADAARELIDSATGE